MKEASRGPLSLPLPQLALALAVGHLLVGVADAEACPNLCSSNGHCDTFGGVCECYDGFYGGDCALRTCPSGPSWSDLAAGVDDAHNDAECSGRGLCDTGTGQCTCETGFEGLSCNRKTCPSDCNGHGVCQSMEYLATLKDPGEGTVHVYTDTI